MEEERPLEVVVDASVVVKWFVFEAGREGALKLRDDYVSSKAKLASPALMPFEVLNAVKLSKRDIEVNTLKAVAESLALYGIELYQFTDRYGELIAETALEDDITIYDASYVALAEYLGAILYTADRELIKKLPDKHKAVVKDIAEYEAK